MNKWNLRYFSLALEVATWSKDPNKQVGAVCVSPDKRSMVVGYNGLPVGIADSDKVLNDKELKNKLMVHAEANCIVNSNHSVRGWTMHVTKAPCLDCAKLLINARMKRVVCPNPGGNWMDEQLMAISLLREAQIEIEFYE
jgi:dCMP deaminase